MPVVLVPSCIQIGGHPYSIKFDQSLQDSGDYGTINHRTQEISINPERPESQRGTSLLHEIVHLVNHIYVASKLEDEEIARFSQGMYQAIVSLGITFDWSNIKEKE